LTRAAHQGALSGKGRTVAVLERNKFNFPDGEAELFERIAGERRGSSRNFPSTVRRTNKVFPIRNRIVAGMTLGTVVVEANLSSGALITANFATEYGRQIFAVPGRIDSPRSKAVTTSSRKARNFARA